MDTELQQVIQQVTGLLTSLGALSLLIEAIVEAILGEWLVAADASPDAGGIVVPTTRMRTAILRTVASAVGVIIALAFGVNVVNVVMQMVGVTSVAMQAPAALIVGQILTGVLLGRGAQWWHDFAFSKILQLRV